MRLPDRADRRGFTLVELMAAVAITGILAAIAYPAYTGLVQRSRRADAAAVLTAVMQSQERHRSNHNSYTDSLATLQVDPQATTRHYGVSVTGVGDPPSLTTGYRVMAAALASGAQSKDSECAHMAIQLQGAKLSYLAGPSATALTTDTPCWGR